MSNKLKQDFDDFINSTPLNPPKELSNRVLGMIREKLNPKFLTLFTKLGVIQAFLGALSLLVCPQYGISFSGNDSLYLTFQKYLGPHGCMIACGVIFTSIAALASVVILERPEIKKIFKFQWFIFPVVAIAFLTLFTCVVREFYLNVSLLWLSGALLGYLVTFDLGYMIREHFENSSLRTS